MVAPLTNFSAFSHEQLVAMLAAGDPATVRSAADVWRKVAKGLDERGHLIQEELKKFAPYWSGEAAYKYKVMMTDLVEGCFDVAEVVGLTRDVTYSSADSLRRAQQAMPAVVAVPMLGPAASAFQPAVDPNSPVAWGALPPDQQTTLTLAWQQMTQPQQQQIFRDIQQHQAAVADAGNAHGQAVAVMNQLASEYLGQEEAVPELPAARDAAPIPTNGAAANVVQEQFATRTGEFAAATPSGDPAINGGQPLFADVYPAGLLAATGAFGASAPGSLVGSNALVGSNGWLQDRRDAKEQAAKSAEAAKAAAAAAKIDGAGSGGMPKIGGAGGAGGGIGSGVGGIGAGGSGSSTPVANPVLVGGSSMGSGSGVAAGAAAALASGASSGAVSASPGMGMMPPMMPPYGGGEGGGRDRHPNWLIERDPVFGGHSVEVTPPVIGEVEEPVALRPQWG
jgi:hypothetical protein